MPEALRMTYIVDCLHYCQCLLCNVVIESINSSTPADYGCHRYGVALYALDVCARTFYQVFYQENRLIGLKLPVLWYNVHSNGLMLIHGQQEMSVCGRAIYEFCVVGVTYHQHSVSSPLVSIWQVSLVVLSCTQEFTMYDVVRPIRVVIGPSFP